MTRARFPAAIALAVVALAATPGAGRTLRGTAAKLDGTTDWRRIATEADRRRLREWRATWLTALTAARAADPAAVAQEGDLFVPDRAMAGPIPPAGAYRCRTFKLGAKGSGMRGFAAYPWFDCSVSERASRVSYFKASGAQRPVGALLPDGGARAVFLGTLVLGDESRPLNYGRDRTRDMAGIVERIGERRWRIALPEPRFESRLDVIEVVPAR